MSATPDQILNHNGGVYPSRTGAARRSSRALVEFRGLSLWVDYFTSGTYYPATADEPAEIPTATVKSIELETYGRAASGEWVKVLIDMSELMDEWRDEIAERLERSWQE